MAYRIQIKNPKKEVYFVEANNKEQALKFFEEQDLIVNHSDKNFEVEKENKSESKEEPKYLIEGYRWFDKISGNTSHKVVITDLKTNQEIYRSKNIVYGYGEQWKQTAYDEMKKEGLVKEEDRNNHELNRNRFVYRQTDVTRKKDLP